jgi:hypothetical protein
MEIPGEESVLSGTSGYFPARVTERDLARAFTKEHHSIILYHGTGAR